MSESEQQERPNYHRKSDLIITVAGIILMIAAVVTMSAITSAASLLKDSIAVNAVMTEKMANLERQMSEIKTELRSKMVDRYTGKQAKARATVVDAQFKSLNERANRIETEHDAHEISAARYKVMIESNSIEITRILKRLNGEK